MQFCDSPALCSAGLWPWASLLLSTHTLLFCLILQNLLPVVLESCPFTCRSAHTEMRPTLTPSLRERCMPEAGAIPGLAHSCIPVPTQESSPM